MVPPSAYSSEVAKPWQRRSGVIRRPGVLGARPGNVFAYSPNMIDGGEDAPMDEQSNRFFKHITIAVLVVIAILAVVAFFMR